MRNKRILLVTLIMFSWACFFPLNSITVAYNPSTPQLNVQAKEALLNAPAYSLINIYSGPVSTTNLGSVEVIDSSIVYTYANLDDSQFKELIRSKTESLVDNPNIEWNKDFLDGYLKDLFPDIYYEIINSNKSKVKVFHSDGVSTNGVTTTQTNLIVYPKTLLGVTLAEFDCYIYWSWNGTQIISVLPTTYGQVYAPSWNYIGINNNIQYFYNNNYNFKKIVTGDFTFTYLSPYWVRHYYPKLDITLYANGDVMDTDSGW